jgi:hypothetical protein
MCFTLRLHTSAAPPRVGLTQALGGKEHSAVALSALQLIGFGQHCSSGCSSARRFFGQVPLARSHIACVALAGFGSGDLHLLVFLCLMRCFGDGGLKVRKARSSDRSSVFGQVGRRSAPRGSVPPNKSFKPTPCRGVSHVLYATLAHVRRPATGRLNSGVMPHEFPGATCQRNRGQLARKRFSNMGYPC